MANPTDVFTLEERRTESFYEKAGRSSARDQSTNQLALC